MKIIEKIGEIFGRYVVAIGIKCLQKRIKKFHIRYFGIRFLKELNGRPYLLAVNHIKPEGRLSQEIALSQDSFVLERVVLERTGRQLRVISKCDNGWWFNNPVLRFLQKYISQPFGEGMIKGIGMLPIKKNPGSFNRNFLRFVESTVKKKEPILIFPEGNWYKDFSPENKLESGAAHLALRYNLLIVPAYVRGCRSWRPQGRIDLVFGASFVPTGKTKKEITAEIRERITILQSQVVK